jgi:hypothetical protein
MRNTPLHAFSLLAVVTALFFGGCASKPKVDWDSRVGNYTFDQAVVELGPPNRETTLSDGKKVAEWVVGHSGSSGVSLGFGTYGGSTGVGVSQSVGSGPREKVLRLTFDAGGKLLSWARN